MSQITNIDEIVQKENAVVPTDLTHQLSADEVNVIVQTIKGLRDGKYEKPNSGIPKSDLESGVQSSLNNADNAYQKPGGGIPSSDMSQAVQTSLGKADTALQEHQQLKTINNESIVGSGNIEVGEVYDISAATAVGGVLTKYADLAAALGTNGANVPEGVRKGGMSVKFVQSSDNKYVQYRYMGTETTGTPNPFLIPNNWQKVVLDKEFTQLQEKVLDFTDDREKYPNLFNPSAALEDKWLFNGGNIRVLSGAGVSDYIPVSPGDVVWSTLNWSGGNSRFYGYPSNTTLDGWVEINADEMTLHITTDINGNKANLSWEKHTIPNGVNYIRLSYKGTTTMPLVYINSQYSFIYYAWNELFVQESGCQKMIDGSLSEFNQEIADKYSTIDDLQVCLSSINTDNVINNNIIGEVGYYLNAQNVKIERATAYISKYINVKNCKYINTNVREEFAYILAYDKHKTFLGTLSVETEDYKYNIFDLTQLSDIYYIRFSGYISSLDTLYLYTSNKAINSLNGYKNIPYGNKADKPYKDKKLVTLGDSITYQSTWQGLLSQMLGTFWSRKETRGNNESIFSEGYGYIKLNANLQDTDDYYTSVDGITLTEDTVTDGFGYQHPIYEDGSGNKYRMPYRMAEGGETLMPMRTTSIYSRATDVKWYKPDLLIVFAGANDKITNVKSYPTNKTNVSQINGWTNLKTDSEDGSFADVDFEIYTNNSVLTQIGTYGSEVGLIPGDEVAKWSATFRACYRGMLKKLVDDNPNTEIVVLGTFSTFIKANQYNNTDYDTYTNVINEVIKEAAREFSCQYIDLNPLFGRYGANKYFRGTDGTVYIHPTLEGGKKIAKYIYNHLL